MITLLFILIQLTFATGKDCYELLQELATFEVKLDTQLKPFGKSITEEAFDEKVDELAKKMGISKEDALKLIAAHKKEIPKGVKKTAPSLSIQDNSFISFSQETPIDSLYTSINPGNFAWIENFTLNTLTKGKLDSHKLSKITWGPMLYFDSGAVVHETCEQTKNNMSIRGAPIYDYSYKNFLTTDIFGSNPSSTSVKAHKVDILQMNAQQDKFFTRDNWGNLSVYKKDGDKFEKIVKQSTYSFLNPLSYLFNNPPQNIHFNSTGDKLYFNQDLKIYELDLTEKNPKKKLFFNLKSFNAPMTKSKIVALNENKEMIYTESGRYVYYYDFTKKTAPHLGFTGVPKNITVKWGASSGHGFKVFTQTQVDNCYIQHGFNDPEPFKKDYQFNEWEILHFIGDNNFIIYDQKTKTLQYGQLDTQEVTHTYYKVPNLQISSDNSQFSFWSEGIKMVTLVAPKGTATPLKK